MQILLQMAWSTVLSAGLLALRAWVLTLLWAWFVVPMFSLPELALLPAVGLSIIVTVFQVRRHKSSDPKEGESFGDMLRRLSDEFSKGWLNTTVDGVVGYTRLLAYGYAVHLLIGWLS